MKPEEIKQFRKSKKWTQKECAEHLGVIQQAVSKWEAGKRDVPLYIEKLIECLKKENK